MARTFRVAGRGASPMPHDGPAPLTAPRPLPPSVDHRAAVLRPPGGPEPPPGLRGQPERRGHAGLCGGRRTYRHARRPGVSRRSRGYPGGGHRPRQVHPDAGGRGPRLPALRALVPPRPTHGPRPAVAEATPEAPPFHQRRFGGDSGRAPQGAPPQAAVLRGPAPLETSSSSCARWP